MRWSRILFLNISEANKLTLPHIWWVDGGKLSDRHPAHLWIAVSGFNRFPPDQHLGRKSWLGWLHLVTIPAIESKCEGQNENGNITLHMSPMACFSDSTWPASSTHVPMTVVHYFGSKAQWIPSICQKLLQSVDEAVHPLANSSRHTRHPSVIEFKKVKLKTQDEQHQFNRTEYTATTCEGSPKAYFFFLFSRLLAMWALQTQLREQTFEFEDHDILLPGVLGTIQNQNEGTPKNGCQGCPNPSGFHIFHIF